MARIVGGPQGWMIAGNRTAGPPCGCRRTRPSSGSSRTGPQLRSDGNGNTWAFDVAPTSSGWLLVGGVIAPGRIDRDPLAWTSADGERWTRVTAPSTDAYEEFQRVAVRQGVPFAVGLQGSRFAAWRLDGGVWQPAGTFGATASGGVPSVRALTVAGDRLMTVVSDGARHSLWVSAGDGAWRSVDGPTVMLTGVGAGGVDPSRRGSDHRRR